MNKTRTSTHYDAPTNEQGNEKIVFEDCVY